MENEKLEHVLRTVDPAKRAFVRKVVIGAAFAVPIVASYSVKDLAYATVGSCPVTVFKTIKGTVTTIVTVTPLSTTTTTTTTI